MATINAENIKIVYSEMEFDHKTVIGIMASCEIDGRKFRAASDIRIEGWADDGKWFFLSKDQIRARRKLCKDFLRNTVLLQVKMNAIPA